MAAISTSQTKVNAGQVITNTGSNTIQFYNDASLSKTRFIGFIQPGKTYNASDDTWIAAFYGDSTYTLAAIPSGSAPEAVTPGPALQNSWVQRAGNAPVGYYKDRGRVYLQGAISGGSTTSGVLLFTLPAGYRPPVGVILTANTDVAPGGASVALEVRANGEVHCWGTISNVGLYFDGLSFAV